MTFVAGETAVPALVLEPTPSDHRVDGARYSQLAALLRDEGWDARITVNKTERRSAVTELVVRLLDDAPGDAAVDALVHTLTEHVGQSLTRRRKQRGRVVLYDAAGSVLRIAEVVGSGSELGPGERRRGSSR